MDNFDQLAAPGYPVFLGSEIKLENTSIENHKVLKTFKGSEFYETTCSHPFLKMKFDHDIPMLEANFVDLEQGTGIVHCAPSHGPDDFNLCLKNNIKHPKENYWHH